MLGRPAECSLVDETRITALLALIQRMGADIPTSPDLLDQVEQALTHVSTGKAQNHERLEFLGDAVLRLAATEFIDRHHPDLSVGACSSLRSQLVSDHWLSVVGGSLDLDPLLRLGRHAQGDASAIETLRADTTEALIGALYTALGDLQAIHLWLTPHWEQTAQAVLQSPYQFNGKSGLQEWTQGQGLGLPTYRTEERTKVHGDPERFRCQVSIGERHLADGLGRSRKEAEQKAAVAALQALEGSSAPH